MQRRRTLAVLAATASTIAGPLRSGFARAAAADDSSGGDGGLAGALQAYRALPGTKSYLIHVGPGASLGRVAYRPSLSLFIASAYKTFVLGQYLRDVEAGLLSEDELLAIDDNVRTLGAPVFLELAGMTSARSVLDAMLAYSDNIATDIATAKVGADRVRALIAQLGLSSIRIPDSNSSLLILCLRRTGRRGLGLAGRSQRGAKLDRYCTAATQRRDHAGRQCARLRFLVRTGASGYGFLQAGNVASV